MKSYKCGSSDKLVSHMCFCRFNSAIQVRGEFLCEKKEDFRNQKIQKLFFRGGWKQNGKRIQEAKNKLLLARKKQKYKELSSVLGQPMWVLILACQCLGLK